MLRSRLRSLALASVAALAASTIVAVSTDTSSGEDAHQKAAAADAPFSLWAPRTVTAYTYRNRTWTDLGLRVIARDQPFELWSTRASYDQKIRTVWRSPGGDVALPAGAMKDFSGIGKFLKLTITPKHGKATVMTNKVCFNGWSERVKPTAAATSPYPAGCWNNPFSLGSVQGVEAGWATTLLTSDRPLHIGAGTYRVRAEVAPKYAALFGLSAAQASRTIKLVVKAEEDEGPTEPGPVDRIARPAAHAPTGPEGRAAGPTPDLRSLPAWGISLSKNSKYLRFSATVWNAGDSPLVVDGFRQNGKDLMDAYQYFFDADGNQTGYQSVGHLHWDPKPSHQHWHFEDFARYSLLRKDKTEAAVSKKEAFCLANTDAVDLTVPSAAWKPENTNLATSCGDYSSLSIREVLAAGWGDTYTQYRAGQSFPIAKLPNGVYYIAVAANPDGHLVETSTTNNVALRKIRLGGKPGERTVKVSQVGIIKDEGYGGTG
ncbi:lysyl oxidase family protein [Nocardioides conyzicola]|uniref:Lysyl oxidase n=1 Tax=Nocardioides conyzicola TaxID=1651781 RepID=A0ABP8WSU4_9ACTN